MFRLESYVLGLQKGPILDDAPMNRLRISGVLQFFLAILFVGLLLVVAATKVDANDSTFLAENTYFDDQKSDDDNKFVTDTSIADAAPTEISYRTAGAVVLRYRSLTERDIHATGPPRFHS